MMDWKIGLLISEFVLKDPKVQEFINNRNNKFDLVLIDQANHESLYMFAHKFNCPLVTFGSSGYTSAMDRAMGLYTPLSLVPHPVLAYTEDMTLLQRCYNSLISTYESLLRQFNYIPAHNKLAKKYFRDGIDGEIPHVTKLVRDISVMLVNSHPSFHQPRPKMPGQIDIAGAHIRSAYKLPADIDVSF